eukprot:3905489-Amphidinium_carterae.1
MDGTWMNQTQLAAMKAATVDRIRFAYGIAIKEQFGSERDLPVQLLNSSTAPCSTMGLSGCGRPFIKHSTRRPTPSWLQIRSA